MISNGNIALETNSHLLWLISALMYTLSIWQVGWIRDVEPIITFHCYIIPSY